MSILGLFILLILICLAFWAARALLTAFGIGDPIATLVYVVLVVLVVLIGLQTLGGLPVLRLN